MLIIRVVSFGFGVTVSLFFSTGSKSVLNLKKNTLLFCSEHLNVFIYVENSVFFKYRKVIFNFKTHMKNLNSVFLRILK